MTAMSTNPTTAKRVALYRFYDATGGLLYVGITDDVARRLREHTRRKEWFSDVHHQAVTWYPNERRARKAESAAIRAERPRYNIAGALKPLERFGVGRELAMIVGVIWIGVPVACAILARWLPVLADVQTWVMYGSPVPVFILASITGTPWIYRYGCWLNRNFGDDTREIGR